MISRAEYKRGKADGEFDLQKAYDIAMMEINKLRKQLGFDSKYAWIQ